MDKEQVETIYRIKKIYSCDDTTAEKILTLAETHEVKPNKGNIELLEFNNKQKNGTWAKSYTPMLTIAALRAIAQSTGAWAGNDLVTFSDNQVTIKGKAKYNNEPPEYTAPEWGYMTVYKMIQGQRVPFVSPKLYFKECLQDKSIWENKTIFMFEKNIEAAALRRAFPEKFQQDYIADEFDVELEQKLKSETQSDDTGLDSLDKITASAEKVFDGATTITSTIIEQDKPAAQILNEMGEKKPVATESEFADAKEALVNCENAEEFNGLAEGLSAGFAFTKGQIEELKQLRIEKGFPKN